MTKKRNSDRQIRTQFNLDCLESINTMFLRAIVSIGKTDELDNWDKQYSYKRIKKKTIEFESSSLLTQMIYSFSFALVIGRGLVSVSFGIGRFLFENESVFAEIE